MKQRYALPIALALCVLPWTAQQTKQHAPVHAQARLKTTPSIDAAAKSAGATDNWLAQVRRRIEQDERQIHRHLNGTLIANTQKGFRAFFSQKGIRAVPDNTEAEQQNKASWSWQYRLYSISRGENKDANMTLLKQPKPTFDGQHVTFTHKQGIVETWENRAEGIEQTIKIQRRPKCHVAGAQGVCTMDKGTRVVLAGVHHSGLEVASSGKKSVQWKRTDNDQPGMLAYQGLVVNDAKGRQLLSGIDYHQGALNLWYDDADAVYPVVVDPMLTTFAWASSGDDQPQAVFGVSVSSAGDVNGDGYSDVIVGASTFNTETGKVYVYHGSSTGLSSSDDWTSSGDNQVGSHFGGSVATAGDVNGDGYSDVIVGAFLYDSASFTNEGKVYVYYGSPNGLSNGLSNGGTNPTSADWEIDPTDQANAQFGNSVATAGDVDGDGYSDVIVGAFGFSNQTGKAYVYYGSQNGLSQIKSAWESVGDAQPGARFGYSVATAGDTNGDGFSDIVIGAHFWDSTNPTIAAEGRAYVYYGSSMGLSTSTIPSSTTYSLVDPTDQTNAQFGYSVATAGDVNGDGYSDVIVGAPWMNSSIGTTYVYYGSSSGVTSLNSSQFAGENQRWLRFGTSVSSAGDVNGDGYSDVIVGSFESSSFVGKAYIYLGSKSGLPQQADWESTGDNQTAVFFGARVATAGDVNGDGYSDVIIGAPGTNINTNGYGGKAYLYYGAAAGLAPNGPSNWEASPADPAGEYFGIIISGVGDVNGDGYSDVITLGAVNDEGRAYVYHGSASGLSPGDQPNWIADATTQNIWTGLGAVAGAGDINGDGYSDVIIAASGLPSPTATTTARLIYTYNGSKQGLSTQPSGFAHGDGQDNSYFGSSIATAGDVNGDGYSDVIVGASGYDASASVTNSGKAYVFHGSSQGLSATADWEAEGDQQAGTFFASSVANAGDVNGDGYSDIIIGAPRFGFSISGNNDGKVYVYHGGQNGLSPGISPDWTAGSTENATAWFGNSVATAGDVNGDGYSDVIIGAHLYDSTQYTNEGRAYVYHGSQKGLSNGVSNPPSADWWSDPTDQSNGQFGQNVASAGDVNGDGYSDVIIGSIGWYDINAMGSFAEGRASVYHGGKNGLTQGNTPDWTIDPTQPLNTLFGKTVAGVGDVNGDGYSDVMISAPWWSGTNKATSNGPGRVYVYHGNQGGGLSLNPKQVRADSSVLVQRNNATGTNSVRLQMRSRVSVGRTRARMVWEIKPRGVLFDGANLSFGTWQDTTLLGTTVDEPVAGLTPGMHYHWRARMQFFPQLNYGRWVSMGPNGKNEADFLAGAIIKYATLTTLPIADPKHGQHIVSRKRTPVLLRFSVRMDSIGGTLKSITLSSVNANPETQLLCDLYADRNQNGAVDDDDRILGTVGLRQGGNITGLDVAMPALSETHYIVQVHGTSDDEKEAGIIDVATDFRTPVQWMLGCVLALLGVLLLLRQNVIALRPIRRLASVWLFASVVVSAACVGRSGFEYAMGDTQLAITNNNDVVITPNVGNEITVRGAPIEGVVFATGQ